jgi:tRNA(His) 5'-end guanylyltransferase
MTDFELLSQKGIGELEKALQRFETYNDGFILPDTRLVLRLDAHRLAAPSANGDQVPQGDYPCGPHYTAAFHRTAVSLMTATYRVAMAYQHGDEISLLIDPTENSNPLRRSKLISSFASAAAVGFLQSSGVAALFDTRLSELPSNDRVLEYFLWQRRYCYRNAVSITLRKTLLAKGYSAEAAEREIHGVSEKDRLSKLEQLGSPIAHVPGSTRRGALFYWESFSHGGREHFRIKANSSLPEDDAEFLQLAMHAGELAASSSTPLADTTPAAEKHLPDQSNKKAKQQQLAQPAASAHKKKSKTRSNVSVFKLAGNT